MKLWPYLLDLTVGSPEREKPLHLWLPLFLLWPLLLIAALLCFVVTLVADVVLFMIGRPYHYYTVFVYRCFELIADTRGLVVRVNDDQHVIDMTLY